MSFHPIHDPIPSRTGRSCAETEIAYFERRLDETITQAANASEECSYAAHAGLAELYRRELSQLRNSPVVETPASPLLEQALEAGVIEESIGGEPRPELALAWRRDG